MRNDTSVIKLYSDNKILLQMGNYIMYKCLCGREFKSTRSLAKHKMWCIVASGEESVNRINNSSKNRGKKLSKKEKEDKYKLFLDNWISEEHICENCGKVMTEYYGSGRFCCKSCANTYVVSNRSHDINNFDAMTEDQRHLRSLKSAATKKSRLEKELRIWTIKCLNNEEDPYCYSYTKYRNALVYFGYKEYKCEICGLVYHNDKKISLHVHHIDADHKNNKLDNIMLLCPNCHSQTDNFGWRSKKINRKSKLNIEKWISKQHTCEYCGKIMTEYYGSGRFCCKSCACKWSSENKGFGKGRKRSNINRNKLTLDEQRDILIKCLNNESKYENRSLSLRDALVKFGYKEYKCEMCGISEWNGNRLLLQIHHVDGNNKNNNINNIKILCPNCHSQTDNYCWKNVRKSSQ